MRTIKYRAKVKMPKRPYLREKEVPEGQWVYGEPHTIDCPTPHIHTVDVGKQTKPRSIQRLAKWYWSIVDVEYGEIPSNPANSGPNRRLLSLA